MSNSRSILLFALGACCAVNGLAQPSIEGYGIGKKRDYLQTSSATPASQVILGDPVGPFHFSADLTGSNLNQLSPSPKVTIPGGAQFNLTGDATARGYIGNFPSQSALDAAFPSGTYVINAGAVSYSISVGASTLFPTEIPAITNGTWDDQGRLVITPATGASLTFNTFSSYLSAPGAVMTFELYSVTGGAIESELVSLQRTNLTGFATEPALTSHTIPANYLQAGRTYYAELSFVRLGEVNATALPAVGLAAYASTTGFIITTAGPTTAPTFTLNPQSQTVTAGGTVTFTAAADGTPAPTFQWRKDGVTIAGATSTSLVLNSVQTANAGTYTVIATNSAGSTTSAPAILTVNAAGSAPTINTQPVSVTVTLGANATFTVNASGTGPFTYQWRKDNVNLSSGGNFLGQTTATLSFSDVKVSDGGSYTVFISNSFGSVTSAAATLTVNSLAGVIGVSTGTTHSLFVRADGTLWGMGLSPYGELGLGNYFLEPTLIASGVVAASAGYQHSLFLKADGSLWALGRNSEGQLGDGTTTDRILPVQVATAVVAISAGERSSLFIKTDGSMWGMGANYYGELGMGASSNKISPTLAVRGVSSVSVGRDFSLFIKWDSSLWGCGSNYSGQLGVGTSLDQRLNPIQITTGVTAASAGYRSSGFVKQDGTAWTMGFNETGQLGDGTTADRVLPFSIATGAVKFSTGQGHSLFLKADGALWGTGENRSGQLGDGSLTPRVSPVPIASNVAMLSAGSAQSLFALTDGSLWGMGFNNYGTLGRSLAGLYSVPIRITPGTLTVPLPPTIATVEQDAIYPRPVRLTWSHVLGASSYEVWRNTTNSSATAVRIATPSIPLYYDASAQAGSTYYYWIKAANGAGASGVTASNPITVIAPLAAAADFNADGKPDLIWSNSKTGERALWLMNGTNFLSASTLGIFPLEWTIAATGDFNADGKPDLVWSNSLTGERALWLMNGTNLLGVSTLGTFPLEWTVAATADFNADGKPDLIWSNSITGERAIWLMNGTNFLGASTLGTFPLEWTVAATGDFNADGKPDLVWSNSLTGERALWLMDGTTRIGVSTLGLFPQEWTVAGTADFNADGKPDIIWSNSITGERALWLMNGTNFLSASTLGIFPLEWTVSN